MNSIIEKEKKLNEALLELKNLDLSSPDLKNNIDNLNSQKTQLEIEKSQLEDKYKSLLVEHSNLTKKLQEIKDKFKNSKVSENINEKDLLLYFKNNFNLWKEEENEQVEKIRRFHLGRVLHLLYTAYEVDDGTTSIEDLHSYTKSHIRQRVQEVYFFSVERVKKNDYKQTNY